MTNVLEEVFLQDPKLPKELNVHILWQMGFVLIRHSDVEHRTENMGRWS